MFIIYASSAEHFI